MELRTLFLTLCFAGVAFFLFGYALKPMWTRVWRYYLAIKAQDLEAQREAGELEHLRKIALQELENGSKVDDSSSEHQSHQC